MIICDNCKKDVTPNPKSMIGEESFPEHSIVNLDGDKKCLCDDCLNTLCDFVCSSEHLKKTKEYLVEMEKEQKEIERDIE